MGIWNALFRRNQGFNALARSPAAVAARFVAQVLVAELADSVALETAGKRDAALAMRKQTLDALAACGLTANLKKAERRFVTSLQSGPVASEDMVGAMWRLEGAAVLAWALGHLDAIPDEIALAPLRERVPGDPGAYRAFCAGAVLQPVGEVARALHDHTMRFVMIEHQPPSEQRSRLLERSRALRWLTEAKHAELSAIRMLG